jgi:hypothetical protein
MKLREFKIAFIDEGYRGYSVVSGMHQEQVLPYIRNQTVILHVREVSPELDAAYAECEEAIEFYSEWYARTLKNNEMVKKQGGNGSFGHVQHDVDIHLRNALAALKKAKGE